MERKNAVIMGGKPMTLLGPEIKVGDKAPDFTCVDAEMKPVRLSGTKGRIRLIASVPSLDTKVCGMETMRFNYEADKLPADKIAVMVVSVDLPFAQERFCSMEGIRNVKVLSDHRDVSMGQAYGVLMKETRLLSRAVFVVDEKDIVRYVEYVKETGKHPDYDAALKAVKDLLEAASSRAA